MSRSQSSFCKWNGSSLCVSLLLLLEQGHIHVSILPDKIPPDLGDIKRAHFYHILETGTTAKRIDVIRTLGKHRDLPSLPRLIRALEDPEPIVMAFAAESLADLGDQRAIKPLFFALERYAAAEPFLLFTDEDRSGPSLYRALRKITGLTHPDDFEVWRRWYHSSAPHVTVGPVK